MRLAYVLVALAVLATFLPSAVLAVDQVCFSVGSFSSSYESGALHVQFTLIPGLGIYDWLMWCWPDTPFAVDVWRHRSSDPCGQETQVVTLPVNLLGDPYVTADIIDADVEPNATYEYLVYGIDGQGHQMAPVASVGYASTGVGLLCRGTLLNAGDCGVSGVPAITACDPCAGFLLSSWSPDATPYFNTQTTLAIYGEVDGLSPALCNVVLPTFRISSVVEQSCVSAVERMTWGAVKAIYR